VTLRPNALDLRADALSNHSLLTHSAAQLVDPDRQIAAVRLVHWYLPGWFLAVLIPVVVLIYFWQSGNAASLRDALRRRFHNEAVVRLVFGAWLGLIVRVAALVPSFYLYRVERAMDQSDQLLRGWAADWVLVTLAWMIVIGIMTATVLTLVDRTHQWYLYTIGGILFVSAGVAYLLPFAGTPLVDRIVPIPARAVAAVQAVEAAARRSTPVVEQIRRRSHIGTAYVAGLGPTQRIVVGDTIFAVAGPKELEYVVARELGYVSAGAVWKIALTDALLFIVGATVAVGIADRIGFRRDDDPVSRFALLGAFFGLMYLVAVPADNVVLRALSREADRYALSLHVDRAAAVRNIVRATDQSLTEVCPDLLARLFMQRVEDPSARVHAINGVPSTCPK